MTSVSTARIHPTALVHSDAVVAETAEIGPYCVIGSGVEIGDGSRVGPHTVIEGPCRIGRENRIYGQASIGAEPQDLKYGGEDTRLMIGDRNRIREFVTIHRGTVLDENLTSLGSDNLIMTGTHIAHDCRVGNGVILGNSATLAGHVDIADHAIVGAFSGIHQFCRVGYRAFVGPYSVITRDALPYVQTIGVRNAAKLYGINVVGLERAGYSSERIGALKRVYRKLFGSGSRVRQGLEELRGGSVDEDIEILLRFIETSERGFVR